MTTRLAVLVLTVVSSLALAQPDDSAIAGKSPSAEQSLQQQKQRPRIPPIEDKLGLTDEQVQQMRAIRDSGGSMADMRAVLTPEQRARAAQLHKERKSKQGKRKGKMQQHLGLTDEQKAKMVQIRNEGGSREDMRAVLTPEQSAKLDALRTRHPAKGPAVGAGAAANPTAPPAPTTPAAPVQ